MLENMLLPASCVVMLLFGAAMMLGTRKARRAEPKQTDIQTAERHEVQRDNMRAKVARASEQQQRLIVVAHGHLMGEMEKNRRFQLRDDVYDAEVVDDAPQIDERKWLRG
jgi:hypothetical protein